MNTIPTVKIMIIQSLKASGHDGLVNADGPCGCLIDELAPCDNLSLSECCAAYKHTHTSKPTLWIYSTSNAPKTDAEIEEVLDSY